MTDPKSAAEIMYPNQQGDSAPGKWQIEIHYLPIGHRGHSFLALVDPNGKTVDEMHGMARSKHTGDLATFGTDGTDLVAVTGRTPVLKKPTTEISPVASGSSDEIGKIWARGQQAVDAINAGKFDYKPHDPAYEFGGNGGEIQNSNSVTFTLGKAMGLDLSAALQDKGMTRTFSGWDRDLLDPNYKPYVAPPVFPVKDAP